MGKESRNPETTLNMPTHNLTRFMPTSVRGAQGLTPLAISMYKETVKCYLCLEPKVSPMS